MFGFNMFNDVTRPFNTQYRCYSVFMLPGNERQDVERGGKIIMPPSALDQLTRLNIVYPMLFKLTNRKTNRITHCGVLEFVADEGKVYLPYWMMRNLLLEEGGLLQVESASLPIATYSKFQPQSQDFLDITNPKAVLENCLRSFACLTSNDIIAIKYNNKIYELCVLETKPGKAVSIIECDMNVEFAQPVDYKEPENKRPEAKSNKEQRPLEVDENDLRIFQPFSGQGNRLDGKTKGTEASPIQPNCNSRRGIPNYDYQVGKLHFIRIIQPISNENTNSTKNYESRPEESFEAFSGEGQSLRKKGRK